MPAPTPMTQRSEFQVTMIRHSAAMPSDGPVAPNCRLSKRECKQY